MNKNKRKKTKYVEANTDAKKIIKVIIFVFLFFGCAYGITIILSKYGVFEKGYTPIETTTEFSDEYILIGTILNRNEKEYYVAFDDFSSDVKNIYFGELIDNTSLKTKIYKVDMSSLFNSKYKKDKSNPKAKTLNNLAIKGETLIKIKNKKIVEYVEGISKIEKILVR